MVAWQAALVALALGGNPGELVWLDFGASWCGPCRQMKPVVEKLQSAGYPVRYVDIERNRELAQHYNVTRVPCFVLVTGDRELERLEGVVTADQLVQTFERAQARLSGANSLDLPQQPPADLRLPAVRSGAPLSAIIRAGAAAASLPAAGDLASTVPSASPELVARLMAASVRLKINDGDGNSVGSGTIIDTRNGEALILTCGHVFRDSQGRGAIRVDLFGPGAPQGVPGRLVSYDLKSDLGFVCIRPGVPVPSIPLASAEHKLAKLDTVVSIGCNHGADPTARTSRVTSIDKFLGASNVEVAGQPVQGRSGGGLFTTDGQLVGVCNAADPADDEGLFASTTAIHAEMKRNGLAAVLVVPQTLPGAPAPLVAVRKPEPQMPEQMPPARLAGSGVPSPGQVAGLNPQEAAILNELRSKGEGAEVICIVRSLSDQRAKSEIIVLDRASPAFLEQLAVDRQRQDGRYLTSLAVPNPRPTSPSAAMPPSSMPPPPTSPATWSWQPQWTTTPSGVPGR